MKSASYKTIELFILFILLPVLFSISFSLWIKLVIGICFFIYVLLVLLKIEGVLLKIKSTINWKSFLIKTSFRLFGIMIVSAVFVWFIHRDLFFSVVNNDPFLWIRFIGIYSLLSVFPQEIIYRTFFFKRYETLVTNQTLFIFINAVIFSLGHIFFKNAIVIGLTFFGGLIFAITYAKTRSTLLVTIEHSIYGSWLFTVGLGTMLGFPA